MVTIIMDSAKVVINAKLAINPDHLFAFSVLATQFASWLRKELSSEVDSVAAVRALSADSSYGHVDLTQLFRVAAHEAKKSCAQSRIFRVVWLCFARDLFFLLFCDYLCFPALHLPPRTAGCFLCTRYTPPSSVEMMFGILFEILSFIFLIRGKRQVYIKSSLIRRKWELIA